MKKIIILLVFYSVLAIGAEKTDDSKTKRIVTSIDKLAMINFLDGKYIESYELLNKSNIEDNIVKLELILSILGKLIREEEFMKYAQLYIKKENSTKGMFFLREVINDSDFYSPVKIKMRNEILDKIDEEKLRKSFIEGEKEEKEKNWHLQLELSGEYNNNINNGQESGDEYFKSRSDFVYGYGAYLYYLFNMSDKFIISPNLNFYGETYDQEEDYDYIDIGSGLSFLYLTDNEMLLTFPINFDNEIVDGERTESTISIGVNVQKKMNSILTLTTNLFADFINNKESENDEEFINFIMCAKADYDKLTVKEGFIYSSSSNTLIEDDYYATGVFIEGNYHLYNTLVFSIRYDINQNKYKETEMNYNIKRKEHVKRLTFECEKEFGNNLETNLYWEYTNTGSNIDLYEYKKSVFGININYKY